MLTVAIDLHSMKKKNTLEVNCFVINIWKMFFFCAQQKKETLIGLEQFTGIHSTIFNSCVCSSEVNPVKMLPSQLKGALLVLLEQ